MLITLSLLHPVKEIPLQVWTFTDESVIRIGRSADNQVVLYSAVVSRHHVELRRSGLSWEVINLGTNGTYLEGKQITQVPIQNGAVIRLARSGPNLRIRIGEAALKESTPPPPPAAGSLPSMMPTQITERPEDQTNLSKINEIDPDEEMLQSEQIP